MQEKKRRNNNNSNNNNNNNDNNSNDKFLQDLWSLQKNTGFLEKATFA